MGVGEPAEFDVFRLAGSTLEGRFVVERAIAEGGFGVVYRAQQTALDRAVAVKVLKTPPELGKDAREHFLNVFAAEAKTIARISHPNIVQVYDFGVSVMPSGERAAWMALEWLTGVPLEEELSRRRGRGGRPPSECLALLRPVLSALATVHAAGVAHRDIKPSNIMLVHVQGSWVPKLLDFGIAKVMDPDEVAGTGQTATRSPQVAFSPAYASPEQVSHGRSGPWTDVHASALLLTEMLTDQPPLHGDDTTTLYQQILDRTRPTPRRFGANVGPWEPILERAAAIAPSDRYRGAGELLAALESTVTVATSVFTPARPAGQLPPTGALHAPNTAQTMTRQRLPAAVAGHTPLGPDARRRPHPPRQWRWAPVLMGGLGGLLTLVAIVSLASGPRTSIVLKGPTATLPAASPPLGPAQSEAPSASSAHEIPPWTPVEPAPTIPVAARETDTARPASARAVRSTAVAPPGPASAPPVSSHPPAAKKPSVNCDPPFSIDAMGNKHYKPECDN